MVCQEITTKIKFRDGQWHLKEKVDGEKVCICETESEMKQECFVLDTWAACCCLVTQLCPILLRPRGL